MAEQRAQHVLQRFCDPSVVSKHFHNALGDYTPCFTDAAVLGTAYVLAITFCLVRLWQSRRSAAPKFRLRGAAATVHVLAACFSSVALLLTLIIWNARIASARGGQSWFVVHGPLAPFEWTAFALTTATHAIYIVTFCNDLYRYTQLGSWLWRFPLLLIAAGQIAKVRLVIIEVDQRGYFWAMFLVYDGLVLVLGLIALFAWPGKDELEIRAGSEHAYQLLADAEFEGRKVCPEAKAGVLSLLTFGWIGKLMREGYRAPLQFEDVWELPPDDRVDRLTQQFRPIWQKELKRRAGPSLTRALAKFTAYLILTALPFKLINDASQFVGPTFINLLLGVVETGQPSYLGYSYATLMLVLLIAGTLSDNQHFQRVMRAGFRLRAVLVHEVFDKVLYLAPTERAHFSSGRVFNLVTTDTETLQSVYQNILGCVSSPVRIIGAVVLLYQQLGPASLVALATLILFMPVQAVMVRISARLLKRALTFTDERAKVEGELLNGMDVVKCSAWQDPFWRRIQRVRGEELATLWRSFIVAAINSFLLNTIPTAVAVASFTVFVLLGNQLTAAKAFTSLSLFTILRLPLFQLPQLISQLVNAQVSVARLSEFLSAGQQPPMDYQPAAQEGETALHVKGSFTWEADAPAALHGIDLEVKQGELIAVVGQTGSGKSSLLSAALGLMQQVEGDPVTLRGKVAFVPQSAFIYNATVRDNILFGLPFEEARYKEAVRVSALAHDLKSMPAGDKTELGERGLNVSGGQKQRISIARAVYSDAAIYMFDDPLSALDAKVAREVFNTCMARALRHRTRVLVTNQLQFVNSADRIVFMQGGTVTEVGTYEELMQKQGGFAQLMSGSEVEDEQEAADDTVDGKPGADPPAQRKSLSSEGQEAGAQSPQQQAQAQGQDGRAGQGGRQDGGGDNGHLTSREGRATGRVSWGVLSTYVKAMGGYFWFSVLMSWFLLVELCRVGATVWLSYWTGATDQGHAPHPAMWYLGIYAAISGVQTLFQLASTYLLKWLSLAAARVLHNDMLAALLRAPMAFFHTTPLGRIINRLTKDTSDVDKNLADFSAFFVRSMMQLVSTIILIGATTPFALPALVPILVLFYFLYQYFQASVREVKRLDSISRSPVYSSIGEALNGLSTIRAYRAEERLSERNSMLVDNSVIMSLINQSMNRWLSIRLEMLGALAAFSAAVLAIEQRGAASTIGLTLSYALQITQLTSITVRLASVAENSFNAVERMGEYAKLPAEAALVVPGTAPEDWPPSGRVDFQDVKMRYRPGLPLVLKGLTCTIPAGTTCGVVGRTGAGKSSLINCLFRLMELDAGRIVIDDVDIGAMGLHQLRNNMAIIPQVPVLFTGTMRSNLDPFEQYSDGEIWAALRRSHLAGVVEGNPVGLDMTLAEGGAPLSAGQKQLVALSRALLRNSRILVLDEATANVDVETDALIQKTVREEFKDRTIIAIAHRLHTIIDCDTVLVMEAGHAVEYGPPSKLLENPNGTFSSMVSETGEATERFLRSVARGEADARQQLDERASMALQRVSKLPDWQHDCSVMSEAVRERSEAAANLLHICLAGLREDAESEETRKELHMDLDTSASGQGEEAAAHASLVRALSLLDDVGALAGKAQELLAHRNRGNQPATPRRSSLSFRRRSGDNGRRSPADAPEDQREVRVSLPPNSPFGDHTLQLLTRPQDQQPPPGASPGSSRRSRPPPSPSSSQRRLLPSTSGEQQGLQARRLSIAPSTSGQLEQLAPAERARRHWAGGVRAARRLGQARNQRGPYSRMSREDPTLSHNPDLH